MVNYYIFPPGNKNYRQWILAQVSIDEMRPGFRVVLEAVPDKGYSLGDSTIAIDEFKVLSGGYCYPKRRLFTKII